ncbi:MAG: CAP domain-containing protein [Bryobacteraceae bacterium]
MLGALVPMMGFAQYAELGPAPRVDSSKLADAAQQKFAGALAAAGWLDTSNREAVRTTYNSVMIPTSTVAMGWTGAVSGCVPGATSAAFKDAVTQRINWYRGMAGVPAGVSLDAVSSGKDQQAALMMSANRTLSHTPPASWTCYTADGAQAAGNSNICYWFGSINDSGCVALYIADTGSNNTAVGHRRWLLYPQTDTMGTGDVSQTGSGASAFPTANAIWVIPSNFSVPRPATRDNFVAWPPKGYVPYQTVPARWSFSYPNASFASTTVTMTRPGGVTIPVSLIPVANGYGENTLVWVANNLDTNTGTWPKPAADERITVTLTNVSASGLPSTVSYDVIAIDPSTASGPPPPPGPTINAPANNQTISVKGVTFQWSPVTGSDGYDLRITQGAQTVFQGSLSGGTTSSTLISLAAGNYTFHVRSCTGGFSDANCGAFSSVNFTVSLNAPSGTPTITAPTNGQTFSSSTQQFQWSAVAGAASYEVDLLHTTSNTTELSLANFGSPPATSTIFSLRGGSFSLRVRACTETCGAWSSSVAFTVNLPAVPTQAPSAPSCNMAGNQATCSWNSAANADIFVIEAVQAAAGPGGGALTVASRQVATTNATFAVPQGATSFFVKACNGNGCGPYSAGSDVNVTAPSSTAPLMGTPVSGTIVAGPDVFFSWNRIPGDNGSNTVYRLYVQDFSRGASALDVLTTANFYAAKFRAGGNRYDAVVVANPGTAGEVTGAATGFNVRGASPASPTMVQPRHQAPGVTQSIAAGNIQLGWSPVPGATLYEYWISRPGELFATARGVTPGLVVQVPLGGGGTTYSGIVRACPAGASCAFGSDAGWGPWSNAAGGPGVTNFVVQ